MERLFYALNMRKTGENPLLGVMLNTDFYGLNRNNSLHTLTSQTILDYS